MKLSGRIFTFVFLVSALALSAAAPAAGAAKAKVPTVKSLLGKQFTSVSVSGSPIIKGRTIGLRFFRHADNPSRPKKPTMVVTGGCNAQGTGFRVRRGRLVSRGYWEGTKIGCSIDPDPWLRSKFKKGLKARVKGNRLILSRPADGVKFVFRRVAPKASTLDQEPIVEEDPIVEETPVATGDPATAESLDGKSFESVKVIGQQLKKPIELGFTTGKLNRNDEDGKQAEGFILTARLGCNWMGGEYKLENGQLTWLDVMQTDMWCEYDKDAWLYDLLHGGVTATTEGSRLYLTKDTTQIVLEQV
ncbi:MAG: META domain-containing protein [Solirubrobacterales bacterium]|nr:META domain-containing protein [Solirubrobacterales bacterium]OJU95685.1 MAG: hypothetical protein BGO23_08760 [Solirubrobacterales bacterium 67-14]